MTSDGSHRAAAGLVGRDYWLVSSVPLGTTTPADIERHVGEHITWLLRPEAEGAVRIQLALGAGQYTWA